MKIWFQELKNNEDELCDFLIASMVIIFASNFFGPTEQPPVSDIKVKQKAESEFSISKEPYEVEENLLEERQFSTDKYVSFSTPLISEKNLSDWWIYH